MRQITQSRNNLIESDDSDIDIFDDNRQQDDIEPAVINVDIHESDISNIIQNNNNNRRNSNQNPREEDESIEEIREESITDDDIFNDLDIINLIIKRSDSNEFLNNSPPDKLNFSYLVFYLLGIATMCPWNFFVTAEDYWMYKFRNVTDNTTELTPWQKSFESYITLTASFSGTIFLILNIIYGYLFSLKLKIIGTLTIQLLCFVITAAFIEINTDNWQSGFFALTIGTIIVINTFSAIFSGALFGIAGLFPSEYMTAVVSGQSLGGILTALAFIATLTFGSSIKATAFSYFILGNLIVFISIIMYFIMSRTEFFKYHLYVKNEPVIPIKPNDAKILVKLKPNIKIVFGKIYAYALVIFLTFATSLTVYPSITVLVQSQYHGNLWSDTYFMPVVNYLIFNSGDYFGRILAGLYEQPRNPHTTLMWTILRMGFVPAFLLCNLNHTYMPTLIDSDITFIILMIIFAISNGFLANNVLINVPKVVMRHEKEMASSIMVTCLSTGLAVGAAASTFLVQII